MSANFSPGASSGSEKLSFWNAITAPSRHITDKCEQRKAKLSSAIALINIFFNGLGAVFSPQPNLVGMLWSFGPLLGLSALAYIITRTRFFSFGTLLVVLGLFISGYTNILLNGQDIVYALLIYISLGLAIGSALLSGWTIFLLLGLNVGFTLFGLPALGIALPANIGAALGPLSNLGLILILLNYFREINEKQRIEEIKQVNQELIDIRENLEKRVEERTQELNRRSAQLEASTLVARSAAMMRSLDELLESVVEQIANQFGYYHVAIFLTDSTEKFVVLQAASSEGGKQLLKRGLKVEIGRQGIVGQAAYQKRPRIVQDVSTESAYISISELSQTHSEAALPLIVRNRVIGVLDIQAEESNAFKFDDIYTLQTMADQVALAIDNTILLEESRANLQKIEAANASNVIKIWKDYLQERTRGFIYTPLGITPITNQPEDERSENEKSLSLALSLRGQPIGTISLKRKASDPNWTEAEREMAERVANQIALAVENARLLEESQRRAAREQKVSEFANRFSRSLDVDALLQNAVRELHSLPEIEEVSVFITPEKRTGAAK